MKMYFHGNDKDIFIMLVYPDKDPHCTKKRQHHLADLVEMDSPQSVMNEIKSIICLIYPKFDFQNLDHVFQNILDLFHGYYSGYRACNTYYHDLNHTLDAYLAMARLLHGAAVSGKKLSKKNITIGLISALMHDTGYIQTANDTSGTGAKYTMIHVQRSIEFMDKYFSENGFSKTTFKDCRDMLNCTGLTINIAQIAFRTAEIELMGKMLGTADLVGQMADRNYLEKLHFLYHEFKEAKIVGYDNELDLLNKTLSFYDMAKERLSRDLGSVNHYLALHFKSRFNMNQDLYEKAIQKNIKYLRNILTLSDKQSYRRHFRRGGLTKQLPTLDLE